MKNIRCSSLDTQNSLASFFRIVRTPVQQIVDQEFIRLGRPVPPLLAKPVPAGLVQDFARIFPMILRQN